MRHPAARTRTAAQTCVTTCACSRTPHVCASSQTSHVTPEQSGPILQRVQPRLAVLHHLIVNDASRDAIITAVRANYPKVRLCCALPPRPAPRAPRPALLPRLVPGWPPRPGCHAGLGLHVDDGAGCGFHSLLLRVRRRATSTSTRTWTCTR